MYKIPDEKVKYFMELEVKRLQARNNEIKAILDQSNALLSEVRNKIHSIKVKTYTIERNIICWSLL